MTRSASESALRALNTAFHVALPLIVVVLVAELPLVDAWAADRLVVGVVAAVVALAAAATCLAALRRLSGAVARPYLLAATGMGALAATYAYAAVMIFFGAAVAIEPHGTTGRLALAILMAAAAVALAFSRGDPPPRDPTARQLLVGVVAAFVAIELFLAASAVLALGVVPRGTLLDLPVADALRIGELGAAALFLATALGFAVSARSTATRRDALLATGVALFATASLVVAVDDRGGVRPLIVELTVLAGVVTCLAGIRSRSVDDRRELFSGIRLLAASLEDGVLLFDAEDRLAWSNDAAGRVLGLDASSYGRSRSELLDATPEAALPFSIGEAGVATASGRWTVVVARDRGGELVARDEAARLGAQLGAAIDQVRDLERVVEIQRADLERTTALDAATGVANRRAILSRLRDEAVQARRYPHPVAVLLLELDAAADEESGVALREVALRLRRRLREPDAISRFGPRQFMLVLPHTDERGVAAIVRSVRRSVVDEPITASGVALRLRLRSGSAVLRSGVEISVDELLARAEMELSQWTDGGDAATT